MSYRRFYLTLKEAGLDDIELSKEIAQDFIELSPLQTQTFPHTHSCLEYLKNKDYQLHIITNGFNEVQGRFYSLGADIGRLEQQIQHNKERCTQLSQDLLQVNSSVQGAEQHINSDNSKLKELSSELEEIQREIDNSTLNKFLNNLQSRIFSNLSRDISDLLFSEEGGTGGTIELEGNSISFSNDGEYITLTVIDENGNITEVKIPIGIFGVCTSDDCGV